MGRWALTSGIGQEIIAFIRDFPPEDEQVYNDRPVRSPEISGSSLDVLNVDIKSVTTSFTNVSLATKQNEGNTWTDGGLSPSPLAP